MSSPCRTKNGSSSTSICFTSHKSQGSTHEYCIAASAESSKTKTSAPGQAYTVLSRVLPSRPKTPYLIFQTKFWNRNKEKYKNLPLSERSSKVSQKFHSLSEEKKRKLQQRHDMELEIYNRKEEELRKKYPQYFLNKDKLPKQLSAAQIYANSKLEGILKKNPEMTRKEALVKVRDNWNQLSEGKKMKWITKAMDAHQEYADKLDAYRERHPGISLKHIILTKEEKIIKDKMEGKPIRPPMNGYSLFCSETMPTLKGSCRLVEASKRWKLLTDQEREEFNRRQKEVQREYDIKYAEFLETLPQEEREKLEIKNYPKSRKNHQCEAELIKKMVQDYESLSQTEKIVMTKEPLYENQTEGEQKKITEFFSGGTRKKSKLETFPDEPKKPPSTGYMVFSTELLQGLKDIPNKERMPEIGRRWKLLSPEEQHKYKEKLDEFQKDYERELDEFRNRLSPDSKCHYNAVLEARKHSRKSREKKGKMASTLPVLEKEKTVELSDQDGVLSDEDADQTEKTTPNNSFKVKYDERLQSPRKTKQDKNEVSDSESANSETDEDEIPSAQQQSYQKLSDYKPSSGSHSGSSAEEDIVQPTAPPKMKKTILVASQNRVSTPFKPLHKNSSTPMEKGPTLMADKSHTKSVLMESDSEGEESDTESSSSDEN
ncbi:hypothetical protein ScPMuIL_008361 [Solemya velum]